jgi:hypothetical protein
MRFTATVMITITLALTRGHAQVVPSAVGPGAYIALGAGVSGFQAVYGQRDLVGGFLYADVHPQWRVGFEGEARFLRFHSYEEVTETNYLGGLRIRLLHAHRLEPYGKFLAGMGRITLPFQQAHGAFLALVPGAGLDVVVNHMVTLRAVDFEYQHWPQFPYGPLNPYGVSAGVRLRVTPRAFVPQSVRKRPLHQSAIADGSQ